MHLCSVYLPVLVSIILLSQNILVFFFFLFKINFFIEIIIVLPLSILKAFQILYDRL